MTTHREARSEQIGLAEQGWRCVFDTHYFPELNSDAGPLFLIYPMLFKTSRTSIWCAQPGLAVLAAFRRLRNDRREDNSRSIAAAIAEAFTDAAVIALTDAVGANAAAETITQTTKEMLGMQPNHSEGTAQNDHAGDT